MPKVIALSGGVGGSKLVEGFARTCRPGELLVIANTGDDFTHLGLHISPDIDTVIYTCTGRSNPQTGWGQDGETWSFMDMLHILGGPDWFKLGDRDLAMHVWRTHRLSQGASLTAVTQELAERCGLTFPLLPMSDDPVRTVVETTEGLLPMQRYFVERRCAPVVTGLLYEGAETARPNPTLMANLQDPELEAIVICPSNPFLSIDPILALPGLRQALRNAPAPVVAVTPIIGGRAIKGPTAKMMAELGLPVDAAAVARHYAGLIDLFVLDEQDAYLTGEVAAAGIKPFPAETMMHDTADRIALAKAVLNAAAAAHQTL
ncbi:2-phospho-L-lactate transferase [Rhodoligotrophos defluvii]|uniref:2-phospho-L-lactate transferase n=1 Tax=Rhodoligotrophos defluvii TaxID=2561934 RepID=UPI0010C9539F|nr:2-phospho-L-lactate transferase [Rhodoligotrophos defluvii]